MAIIGNIDYLNKTQTRTLNLKLILLTVSLLSIYNASLGQGDKGYIYRELKQLNTLIAKGNFVKGDIYKDGDTISTQILVFHRRSKANASLFCISKNKSDSIIIHKPFEISDYKTKESHFISHTVKRNHYFIEHIKKGKVDLYQRSSVPSDPRFLYYFKFPNEKNYIIINPNTETKTGYKASEDRLPTDRELASFQFYSSNVEEKFSAFISDYMSDCTMVVNMVKSKIYSISDIPSIVSKYNKCFENTDH